MMQLTFFQNVYLTIFIVAPCISYNHFNFNVKFYVSAFVG